jgi:hypothetical protein
MLSKHGQMLRMLIVGSKMLFTFKRKDHNFSPVGINGTEIEKGKDVPRA